MQCLRLAILTRNPCQLLGELSLLALCWLPRMSGIVQLVPCALPPIVRVVLLEYFPAGKLLDLPAQWMACPAQITCNQRHFLPTPHGHVFLPPNSDGKDDAIAVSSLPKHLISWLVGCPWIFVTVHSAIAFRVSCSELVIPKNLLRMNLLSKPLSFWVVDRIQ